MKMKILILIIFKNFAKRLININILLIINMNRLLLVILLIGIGIYIYLILVQPNITHFTKEHSEKIIIDDFINCKKNHNNLKVHFSDKVDIKHIENKDDTESLDELFLLKPREVESTNLTMSENEYFN